MKALYSNGSVPVRLLLITLVAALAGRPAVPATEADKAIVSAVQPFVEAHTLAGAVMLVAAKDKVLKPLGVKDTIFWPDPDQVRRLAKFGRWTVEFDQTSADYFVLLTP